MKKIKIPTPGDWRLPARWVRVELLFWLFCALLIWFLLLPSGPGGGKGGVFTSPKSPQAYAAGLARGNRLLAAGEEQKALACFQQLTEAYPQQPAAYNDLAAIYARRGKLTPARKALLKALKTSPGYATVYANLGVVYAEIARDSYGKALHLGARSNALKLQLLTIFSSPGPARPATAAAAARTAHRRALPSGKPHKKPALRTPKSGRLATATSPHSLGTVLQSLDSSSAAAAARATPSPRGPEGGKETLAAGGTSPAGNDASPAAAAPAAKAPPSHPSPAQEDVRVLAALQNWAAAWSAQNVPAYLAAYSPSYRPFGSQSRAAWEKLRRRRLTRPRWIKVTLSQIEIVHVGGATVHVSLVQDYDSDRYRDRSRKLITLVREHGHWRIVAERTLGSLK